MRKKFYVASLALVFLFFFSGIRSLAQTTVSTTGFVNNNSNAIILFNFRNNNATGVIITDIASICSANGLTEVSAYYNASAINDPPPWSSGPLTPANGWFQFGSATIVGIANTTTTTTQPFMSGLSLVVPAGATYGICVQAVAPGTTTARLRYSTIAAGTYTFSAGGCDIITGTNIGWGGPAVLPAPATPGTPANHPRGFMGSITFIPAIPPNQPCAESFDGVTAPVLPTGWVATENIDVGGNSNLWATTNSVNNSSPNSAWTNDPNNNSDEWLDSKPFPITSATAQLRFSKSVDLEESTVTPGLGFDGMVLEISIGGGPFQDIVTAGGVFVNGGYTHTISNSFGSPIGNRMAWSGNSGGFTLTTVDLPAAANGQNIVLRWRRATDNSVSDVGVWIDDIEITGSNCGMSCQLTCPANIVVNNDPNQCGAVVNYPMPTTNGACGTMTGSPSSGSFFPVGTTTVTVNSFSGVNCSFTVRVNDVQAPVLGPCPANIVTGNSPNQCGANVSFTLPSATDNCPGVVVTSTPASGSFFPVGTTTVTVRATDAASNTSTCTFTVTVNDTQGPTFGSLSAIPERLYYKFDGSGTTVPNQASAPPPGTATATILGLTQGTPPICGSGSLLGNGQVSTSNHVNTGWATNLSGSWTISFKTSNIPPSATLFYIFGDATAGSFRCFTNGVAGANNWMMRGTGITDIIATGGATVAPHTTTFVYNSAAGNITAYVDGAVVATVAQPTPITNSSAGPFQVGGYATNTCLPAGGLMDEFAMFNRALSAAEVSMLAGCPVAASTCPAPIVRNTDPGTCGAVVTYTTPTAVDNCPGSVTTIQIAGLPSGSTFPVGTTTNIFRATDAAGNTATCTFTVTVNDTQAPAITCPANITQATPIGSCTAVVNYTVTATDNCPGVTTALVSGPASGSAFPLGTTTVRWRATDAAGNTSTCQFTVTVTDAQIPVISVQPAEVSACVGSNAVFTVTAAPLGGPSNLTYQWEVWNPATSTWVAIGSTSANPNLTVPNVTMAMAGTTYRVRVIGLCTTITSGMASLRVRALPTVSLSTSRDPALTPGQLVNITASVSVNGGTIQWYKNGVPMGVGSVFMLSNLTVDDVGTYHVVYTAPNGCTATSNNVIVSKASSSDVFVYPNPNNGQFQVRVYQPNTQITITVYDGKGAMVYQRSESTGTVPYTRIDVNMSAMASGQYVVEVRDSGGNKIGVQQIVVWR